MENKAVASVLTSIKITLKRCYKPLKYSVFLQKRVHLQFKNPRYGQTQHNKILF